MSFKIRRKLMGAFLVMLIPLAVLIGINRYNQRVIHLATHKVEDIHKEISSLSDLQIALNMLIMPPNDYLITGDISERVEFNHIITEIEGHLLNISTTIRCNKCHEITDEMVKKLYRVESDSFWSEEMASVKEIMDGLQIVKEKGEKIFKIEKPVGSTEGAMLMKEMDAIARNLIKEDILKHKKKDEKELISAIKDSERLWRLSWFMMIGGFALSVSMGLLFAFFYSGFFVRPIQKLHHGADAIAGGDFKSRVDVKTGDELEQLANGMNEMADKLDNFYGSLENQVMERTRELQESEERFRVIAETAADAIITMKRPGIVTLWNKSAESMFGYAADEVMGKDLHDIIVPEKYREKEREGLKSFFEMGTGPVVGKRIEVFALRKDGSEFPVELSISGMRIRDEWQAAAIVRDITERKAAEEELRLRAQLLDSVSDTIFVLDFNGNFIYLNEAAWKTRGYTRDEMMGINLHVLDTPKYEKLIESRMRDLMEKGRCMFESEQRRKDGSIMPVEINACVIELGGRKLSLSIICDITERKRAEEELMKSRQRAQHYLDIAGVMLLSLDAQGRVQMVNRKGCEMLGHSETDILGKDWFDNYLPEPVRKEVREIFTQMMDGNIAPVEYFENDILTGNGDVLTVAWHNSLLLDESGRINGALSSGEDITERKKAEQELAKHVDELERYMKATVQREFRIKELRDKVEELEKRLKG